MYKEYKEKIDSAIILATFTAFGYVITYIFLTGYNSYYKLPSFAIDLNITSMIPILFAVYLIMIGFFVIVVLLKHFIIDSILLNKFIQSQFMKNLQSKAFNKDFKSEFIKSLKVFYKIAPSLLFSITLYNYADFFGERFASAQKEYMVIQQKEELYVGLTSFKDLIIIAPLNIKKETMTPKFTIIEVKELKEAEVIHFENGLKVEDIKNSPDLTE
ncbi:hypothetical protein ACQ5SI_18580 [Peribacillus frigoritolerans]|uniref:hypothetical protein n=1 Tax=Peribacillus frigoritolerans TaxID=450367 RepID=UPI003D33C56C